MKVRNALIKWLEQQEDKDKTIILANHEGKYTASNLIKEIENSSSIGSKIEEDIIILTIDLLFRKKESI